MASATHKVDDGEEHSPNSTDIFGYADPNHEALCLSVVREGVTSAADVL